VLRTAKNPQVTISLNNGARTLLAPALTVLERF